MFSSLRTRNYRLFATGQVVSNTGTWMQRIAQDWLVLQLSHGSGTVLGVTTALQFLPLLLLSLWGGMVADRYRKRRVLIVTQAVMGVLAAVLGALALTGAVRIWHVYALALALGIATVVDNPTRQAFVPEMVGREHVQNAIALNSAVFNLARLVGPALAGVLIGVIGTGPVFVLNAVSYAAVLVGLLMMREEELHPVPRAPRTPGQLRDGLRHVAGRPELVLPLALMAFVATFGMNFQVTTALVTREVFHADAGRFGLASSMFAVGALVGALLAARRDRPGRLLLVGTALAFGLLETLSGLMPTYAAFLVALVPTGIALLTYTTATNATLQLNSSPQMRGRVMGVYLLVFFGGAPLGSPLVGWVSEQFGARMGLVAGGVVSALAAVVVGVVLARRAHVPLRPRALVRRGLTRCGRGRSSAAA